MKTTKAAVPLVSQTLNQQVMTGIARQLKRQKLTKSALAKRMKTSRGAVQRIMNEGQITLSTLGRCAAALGCKVSIRITD